MTVTRWFAEHAWLPSGFARNVLIEAAQGRFTRIVCDVSAEGASLLPGVVLPGFANNHSHAFHRALRGRTHDRGGTFWTWREAMYDVAARLDCDSYLALARATYAEMALAGITSVGEFHYLHHTPSGAPYQDPNAMGLALIEAAGDAGVRLTLLDTCYLFGGLSTDGYEALAPAQQRFGDGDVSAWAARVAALREDEKVRIGAAIHSVRAVDPASMSIVAGFARERPLHVHLSEQVAENEACLAVHGCTPTALLAAQGVLGANTTTVHATHLTSEDVAQLAETRTTACICPTTERDLGDGIGPTRSLSQAGVPLSLGSDQHAVIDLLVEAQCLEGHDRLASQQRGRFTVPQLLDALTNHGGLGWPDAGRIEVGARADLVAVRSDTVRTSGSSPEQIVLTGSAPDVDTVVVECQTVVSGGVHVLGDVASLLRGAIEPLWDQR